MFPSVDLALPSVDLLRVAADLAWFETQVVVLTWRLRELRLATPPLPRTEGSRCRGSSAMPWVPLPTLSAGGSGVVAMVVMVVRVEVVMFEHLMEEAWVEVKSFRAFIASKPSAV